MKPEFLNERVQQEMLLISPAEGTIYECMLFDTQGATRFKFIACWPLMSGDQLMLGRALKPAQCERKCLPQSEFTVPDCRTCGNVAVDNALALPETAGWITFDEEAQQC